MSARPYQQKLVDGAYAAWDAGHRAVVVQSPTGSGKTHTAAEILALFDGPVIFAAHLDSLCGDTAARLRAAGLECGIVAPWATAEPQHRIQVCSTATLNARGTRPPAKLVILDECHRSEAPTVKAILADYPEARILGLTATPQRGDGAPLGDTFSAMVSGPTVRELTAMGALVPSRLVVPVDDGGRGDVVAELGRLKSYRALIFAESIAEAKATAARLGDGVGQIYGDTPRRERERLRAALRSGELRALIGVGVFVEGFDEPSVDVVALDATFGTLGRYLQAIGRGLRPFPGKTECTVLDLRGAVFLHLPPDVDHEWSLTGEPTIKRVAGLAFSRCGDCWAVFERASVCPRCGATRDVRALPIKRIADASRMEAIAKMDPAVARQRYHAKLVHIGVTRRRMSPIRAKAWADAEIARRGI